MGVGVTKAPTTDTTHDAALQTAMTAYRVSLRNAASRDREMEELIRRYLGLTRGVFEHFKLNRPTPGDMSTYDPLPAWRFQGQQSFEYRLLAARAAVVQRHLTDLATAQHLQIQQSSRGRDRGARIGLYSRIFGCIRQDATVRAAHGRRYLARNDGATAKIAPDQRLQMYQDELSMLRESVRCTSLTTQRRPDFVSVR